jgi:transcriptional regulator with XRE-family HTH domain
MAVGLGLKALRVRKSISVREVERASKRIAAAAGDVRFRISNGWLVQLEKGTSEPGLCKLFSLSVIYQVHFLELIRLYDIDVGKTERLEPIANPQQTRLLSESRFFNESPRIVDGYIGSTDFTMYPLIRPGSFVQIDTELKKPAPGKFNSEYERPIYFVELRGDSVCGWCELHGKELLVIPHPASPAPVRRFVYQRDAEIVGQVVAFYTRWVDESER